MIEVATTIMRGNERGTMPGGQLGWEEVYEKPLQVEVLPREILVRNVNMDRKGSGFKAKGMIFVNVLWGDNPS